MATKNTQGGAAGEAKPAKAPKAKAPKPAQPTKPTKPAKPSAKAKAQRAMMFDQIDYSAAPNGDRTRIVRVSVRGWSKLKPADQRELKVAIGTRKARRHVDGTVILVDEPVKLRWNEVGQAFVVDGSAPHADIVARLDVLVSKVDGVTYEQHIVNGSWLVARGAVLLSVPAGVTDEKGAFAVGMPVMGLRGSTWRRWRNTPPLWSQHKALIDHIARATWSGSAASTTSNTSPSDAAVAP